MINTAWESNPKSFPKNVGHAFSPGVPCILFTGVTNGARRIGFSPTAPT